jgi:hypothetical protein
MSRSLGFVVHYDYYNLEFQPDMHEGIITGEPVWSNRFIRKACEERGAAGASMAEKLGVPIEERSTNAPVEDVQMAGTEQDEVGDAPEMTVDGPARSPAQASPAPVTTITTQDDVTENPAVPVTDSSVENIKETTSRQSPVAPTPDVEGANNERAPSAQREKTPVVKNEAATDDAAVPDAPDSPMGNSDIPGERDDANAVEEPIMTSALLPAQQEAEVPVQTREEEKAAPVQEEPSANGEKEDEKVVDGDVAMGGVE